MNNMAWYIWLIFIVRFEHKLVWYRFLRATYKLPVVVLPTDFESLAAACRFVTDIMLWLGQTSTCLTQTYTARKVAEAILRAEGVDPGRGRGGVRLVILY
jgi:hypothetical protein